MYQGLLWVMENRLRYRIRVLNISVGIGESGERDRMAELAGLLESVVDQGVVVICAAGNKGPGEGTLSPLGESRRVITVGRNEGGYFGARKDLCENYSGRGRCDLPYRKPDIVAPGTDVVSCNGGCYRDRRGAGAMLISEKAARPWLRPSSQARRHCFCRNSPMPAVNR